ncbi:hypothetical protein THS27_14715 [Thalassospira sp. MCCC 1A01428]|nr:hypothetical protein THS27_14715 [Thalassospira sp. MCCC 1A01428]
MRPIAPGAAGPLQAGPPPGCVLPLARSFPHRARTHPPGAECGQNHRATSPSHRRAFHPRGPPLAPPAPHPVRTIAHSAQQPETACSQRVALAVPTGIQASSPPCSTAQRLVLRTASGL